MADGENWVDIGAAEALAQRALQTVAVGKAEIALSFKDGTFGAIGNACAHAGYPLGEGSFYEDGDYIMCPWHYWKFHRLTGVGEPGLESDCVSAWRVKVEDGRVLVDLGSLRRPGGV